MGVEERLLTKVLETGAFRVVEANKISASTFTSPINRLVYQYIRDWFYAPDTRGHVPTLDDVLKKFGEFKPERDGASLTTLCAELRKSELSRRLVDRLERIANIATIDPDKALQIGRESFFELAKTLEVSKIDSLRDIDDVLEAYQKAKSGGGVVGIPFPWDSMTEASGGMRPGEFHVFYGRPKSMKTWLLLNITIHAFNSGRRALLVTTELPILQVKQRMAAMFCSFDYERFRKGQLTEDEEALLMFLVQTLFDDKDLERANIHIVKPEQASVEYVAQKIEELRPDIVCIDSAYKLGKSRRWDHQAEVALKLKRLSTDFEIPVVITTQANRNRGDETGSDMAFSDAYGQDADGVFRVDKIPGIHANHPPDAPRILPRLFISVTMAREFQMEGFIIDAWPAVYFTEVAAFSEQAFNEAYKEAMDMLKKGRLTAVGEMRMRKDWTE